MYTITLKPQELELLRYMLDCALQDIHSEIVHTDCYEYKEMLKSRKQVMLELLNNLKEIQPEVG